MGTLFGFAVGYLLGARAGSQGFDEVAEAFRAVRTSAEFQALVEVVKSHAKGTAALVSERLSGGADPQGAEDLLARARDRARNR